MLKTQRIVFGFLLGVLLSTQAIAQLPTADFFDSTNVLRLPIGYVRIGDQNYVGLRLQPEIKIWKLGIGFNIPLFFSLDNGSFRTDEFQNGSGAFRIIDYIRFGQKERDKFYVKLGTLNQEYLGYGYLMNNYTNAASYERRKLGLSYDVRFLKIFGIEGNYSDLRGLSNIWAFRPYVKPLEKTAIPILKTLEMGFGFMGDRDEELYNAEGLPVSTQFIKDGIKAWSADLGLNVLKSKLLNINAYVQYARLGKVQALADSIDRLIAAFPDSLSGAIANGYKAGNGFNIGVQGTFDLIANILKVNVRLERNWQQEHFLPQFFDLVYEIDKDGKLWQLANTESVSGTYGVITATIMNNIHISGGLQIPDKVTDATPALIQLALSVDELIPNVIVQGSYLKGNLGNLADAFKLDERSLLNARFAYKINKNFVAGLDYRWTFAEVEQDGQLLYKATNYVMPYFGLNFSLFKKRE